MADVDTEVTPEAVTLSWDACAKAGWDKQFTGTEWVVCNTKTNHVFRVTAESDITTVISEAFGD